MSNVRGWKSNIFILYFLIFSNFPLPKGYKRAPIIPDFSIFGSFQILYLESTIFLYDSLTQYLIRSFSYFFTFFLVVCGYENFIIL